MIFFYFDEIDVLKNIMLRSKKPGVQQLENKHNISDNLADEEFQDIILFPQ